MGVRYILRAIWHNKSFLIRFIVILCLSTVTVIDSIGIITTYVYDNRLTVVRTEMDNDSAAFLENITIRYMGSDSALPKSWVEELNMMDVANSEFYSSIRQEILHGEMPFSLRNKSSIDAKAYALCFFDILAQIDNYGLYCLFLGRHMCNGYKAYTGNYSRILRDANSAELQMLEEEALSEYLTTFVTYYDWKADISNRPSNFTHALTIHNIQFGVVNMEINPADYPLKHSSNLIVMNLRMNERRPLIESVYSVLISVGRTSQLVQFQQNVSHSILLDIKNLGIYDKSQTTKCTRDPEVTFFDVTHPQCDHRGFLKAIVEKCGCIPFTAKKHLRKYTTLRSSTTASLPFCDFQRYYSCSAEIGPMALDPKEDCLPSCVSIRNQYTFVIDANPCVDGTDECSFVGFTVRSSDHSYVMYEDRYQTTFPQFVSQLGGDIGLYLGLSLLSVWQLVAFVQRQYRNYKMEMNSIEKKQWQFVRTKFLAMMFKEIKESIGSIGENDDKSTMKEDSEESRWKDRVSAAMQKIKSLEQMMQHQLDLLPKLIDDVVERKLTEKLGPKRLRKIEMN